MNLKKGNVYRFKHDCASSQLQERFNNNCFYLCVKDGILLDKHLNKCTPIWTGCFEGIPTGGITGTEEKMSLLSDEEKKEAAHRRNMQLVGAFTEMFKAMASAKPIPKYASGMKQGISYGLPPWHGIIVDDPLTTGKPDAHGDILAKGVFDGAIRERVVKPILPDEYIGREIKRDKTAREMFDETISNIVHSASKKEKGNPIISPDLEEMIKDSTKAIHNYFGVTDRLKEAYEELKKKVEPKQYVLLKDCPEATAGSIVIWNEARGEYVLKNPVATDCYMCWQKSTVENNPEWFKAVEEKKWTDTDMIELAKMIGGDIVLAETWVKEFQFNKEKA